MSADATAFVYSYCFQLVHFSVSTGIAREHTTAKGHNAARRRQDCLRKHHLETSGRSSAPRSGISSLDLRGTKIGMPLLARLCTRSRTCTGRSSDDVRGTEVSYSRFYYMRAAVGCALTVGAWMRRAIRVDGETSDENFSYHWLAGILDC